MYDMHICTLAVNVFCKLFAGPEFSGVYKSWISVNSMAKTIGRENTKFSNNIYLPWPFKFTTILQLKEIPIQERSMSNLRPLMQKSVIYQIERKTLFDSVQSTTTHYVSKGY